MPKVRKIYDLVLRAVAWNFHHGLEMRMWLGYYQQHYVRVGYTDGKRGRVMTREDAIYWLKNLAVLSTEKDMPQIEEALNMAIEALTERPCENCQEWDCYGCDYKQTERSRR